MLTKIVKEESRGTMLGAFSLAGSIGVLLINKLGGFLYDNVSHEWPFYITLMAFLTFTVLTFTLGVTGRIKV